MNTMLGKIVSDNHRDWHTKLPFVLAAYRATEHGGTSFTPNRLFLGREARTYRSDPGKPGGKRHGPLPICRGTRMFHPGSFYICTKFTGRYATTKKRYDLRVRRKTFQKGNNPRKGVERSPKWTRVYTGPYLITNVNSIVYEIQRSRRARKQIVHVDKLKLFEGDEPVAWLDEPTGENETVVIIIPSWLEKDNPLIVEAESAEGEAMLSMGGATTPLEQGLDETTPQRSSSVGREADHNT